MIHPSRSTAERLTAGPYMRAAGGAETSSADPASSKGAGGGPPPCSRGGLRRSASVQVPTTCAQRPDTTHKFFEGAAALGAAADDQRVATHRWPFLLV